ncbi:MAG: efflux RND transporter periplasmic adaptor subunit [bacterium]|nr:efflux RND transporter periplasmic adaptor subunit [bacterium]
MSKQWFRQWTAPLLSSLALAACSTQPPPETPQSFPVAAPGRATATWQREYVGEVQAIQRADVLARVKGRIESVAIDEGQPVAAGQLLFSISDRELQQELRRTRAAVASAAAELKAAETERASARMLLEKRIVAPAEVALLDARIQALAAKLEEARASEGQAAINLGYAEVRAPFAGVVNRLARKAGSLVDDGDLLTTVTDASEVFVYFRVPESEYLRYVATNGEGRSKEVAFVLADGTRLPAAGVVDTVETEVDRSTGTIAFRARFPNERNLLKHGSSGKVVVTSFVNDAITIPQKSTFEVQDHLYVYVVDADGTVRARKIVPKVRLDGTFVIESGIDASERFVVEGIQKLKDGTKVAVRPDAPDTAPVL